MALEGRLHHGHRQMLQTRVCSFGLDPGFPSTHCPQTERGAKVTAEKGWLEMTPSQGSVNLPQRLSCREPVLFSNGMDVV